jgi:serine O-acetyltransferase
MLREDLKVKARHYYQRDDSRALLKVLATDGTGAMVIYRLMQGSRDAGLAPLEMMFNKINAVTGCVIGRGAEFGPGFVLFHSHGVVINGKVKGGDNVHLQHEVTLGDNGYGGTPVIGSNVLVGAGAKVIGAITVGDGARIGANAVVVKDVDANTTVVGIPAKPVGRKH